MGVYSELQAFMEDFQLLERFSTFERGNHSKHVKIQIIIYYIGKPQLHNTSVLKNIFLDMLKYY